MNTNHLTYHHATPKVLEMMQTTNTKNTKNNYDQLDYDNDGAFIIKPAGAWLEKSAQSPSAKMLFDGFWFEDELCILFADTNAGKSILAVQIGDSISKGTPITRFATPPEKTVLYFDFELSDKQFRSRYHNPVYGTYSFNPKFLRAVFNPLSTRARKFHTFQDYINHEIENALVATKAKVLIIDNITCLRYGINTASGALNLLRSLQAFRNEYGLSILVLAHTPKRNQVKPISRNDLQGSKMLINFCDSAFAIGESQTVSGWRYLKQIKQVAHIIKKYKIGVFWVRQPKVKTVWLLAQLMVAQWDIMLEKSANLNRPFLCEVTKTGVSELFFG